jgi:release factor glutamine methyltransferase
VLVRNLLLELPRLISGKSDTSVLDIQVLLAHIMGKSRTWILAHPDTHLSKQQEEHLQKSIKRLENGEPLPYILGHWEFYGLDFKITSDVLIPRPETELLVDQALSWIREHPNRGWALDIGTGSGCIAIALAVNTPNLLILASDISLPALKITQQNAHRHSVTKQVFPIAANLFPPMNKRFNLICANLPYIPTKRLLKLKIFGEEPNVALDGGIHGLDFIMKIVQTAPNYLHDGGIMLLEIDQSQGNIIQQEAEKTFPSALVSVLPDLAGKERLVYIQT